MRNILIDTDPGHDDALAIILAVKSGQFNIAAITTVAGNSNIENTTRNARYILKLLDREDIPVYSGAEKPLARELVQAVVHGKSGLEGIDPTNPAELTGDGVDQIISIIEKTSDVTIVTLGPLTNIAQAIQKTPDVMERVKEIVMMGGAIQVPGNKNRVAEFNVFVDPEAADVVFRFPVKKTLVPLDACNHVQLRLEDFEKIANPILRKPILAMMKPFIENISVDEGVKAALVYDALTIYYLLNSSVCKTNNYDIIVETKGEITRGMTVADLRTRVGKEENVTVVEHIPAESSKKDFIAFLNS